MNNNGLIKTVVTGMTSGKKKRGRPSTKWISNIKEWCDGSISDCIYWAQVRIKWKKRFNLALMGIEP